MTRKAPTLAALAAVLLLVVPAVARSQSPEATDLTQVFRNNGLTMDSLRVVEVGGIVIMRGRTTDPAEAQQASRVAQSLGFNRVANLIQVTGPVDDAAIQRAAERQLSINRALDGCNLRVNSQDGIVTLAGNVNHELQKDVAVEIIRNIDGVRAVRTELQRF